MGDRPTSKHSLISQTVWGGLIDMWNWWKRTYAFGSLNDHVASARPTDLVKVGNDTADNLVVGNVLQLGAKILGTIDASIPAWIVGVKPTAGNVNVAVLLAPCPAKSGSDRSIVPAQVNGVCFVKVDVVATWHRRARPVKDAYILTSGLFGPCEILVAPTATGEQICLCSVGHADNRGVFCKTTSEITAGTLTSGRLTLGSGTAKIHDPYTTATQYDDSTHELTVYNMAGAAVTTGEFKQLIPTDDWLPLVNIDPCQNPA